MLNEKQINEIVGFIKKILENPIDFNLLLINMFITVIVSVHFLEVKITEIFYNRKKSFILGISLILAYVLQLLMQSYNIFFSIASSLTAYYIYCKFISVETKNDNLEDDKKELPIITKKEENKTDRKQPDDLDTKILQNKLLKIGKSANFNILDILYLYGYISDLQRRKFIQSLIFEDPNESVEELLYTYTIDERDLKEARAILNLIGIENRLVSKKEALSYLISIKGMKQ